MKKRQKRKRRRKKEKNTSCQLTSNRTGQCNHLNMSLMQTLSNRQRNHTNRSHRSVKKYPSSVNRHHHHLIGKLTAKQLSPLTRLVVHLDDCTAALPGYWPWIFHLLLRTRVLASSCCCCFDFERRCVRPLSLTHSFTKEREKEEGEG